MSPEKDLVAQSFGRCCVSARFFDDFYDTLFKSAPRARDKFKNIDMPRQKGLLCDDIAFMIMFFDGSGLATVKVGKLSTAAARQRLNIEPELYKSWLDALMTTVARHDPGFNPELERAWRAVMGKVIAAMSSEYARTSVA